MKILVLDNYDSFTYNLVHMLRDLGCEPDVIRNDKIELADVAHYDKILLSPGPGIPSEAGVMQDLIKTYAPSKDILGVCLGHQGIAEAFGSSLLNLDSVLHGVTSTVTFKSEDYLFNGMPASFRACHYHSWVVDESTLPAELIVTSTNNQGLIMSIRHAKYRIRGVQFHPEAIMTEHGLAMMNNWLKGGKRRCWN